MTMCASQYNFAKVSREVGLRAPEPDRRYGHGPRLHDMRHRFAVQTLIDWYRAGVDVEREIPKLATYLGHVHVNDTYWYIEGVPELLELARETTAKRARTLSWRDLACRRPSSRLFSTRRPAIWMVTRRTRRRSLADYTRARNPRERTRSCS